MFNYSLWLPNGTPAGLSPWHPTDDQIWQTTLRPQCWWSSQPKSSEQGFHRLRLFLKSLTGDVDGEEGCGRVLQRFGFLVL